jgi:hypothetical protein
MLLSVRLRVWFEHVLEEVKQKYFGVLVFLQSRSLKANQRLKRKQLSLLRHRQMPLGEWSIEWRDKPDQMANQRSGVR